MTTNEFWNNYILKFFSDFEEHMDELHKEKKLNLLVLAYNEDEELLNKEETNGLFMVTDTKDDRIDSMMWILDKAMCAKTENLGHDLFTAFGNLFAMYIVNLKEGEKEQFHENFQKCIEYWEKRKKKKKNEKVTEHAEVALGKHS